MVPRVRSILSGGWWVALSECFAVLGQGCRAVCLLNPVSCSVYTTLRCMSGLHYLSSFHEIQTAGCNQKQRHASGLENASFCCSREQQGRVTRILQAMESPSQTNIVRCCDIESKKHKGWRVSRERRNDLEQGSDCEAQVPEISLWSLSWS